ncbi:MAG: DDE-type integrase/transposase/recombinase [Nanoarchaeota archaeon]
MKLRNPHVLSELRKFYSHGWCHADVQQYLLNHHGLVVSVRTLKRWKKRISDASWCGPKVPVPPKPLFKVTPEMLVRICRLRKKSGWGRVILKQLFPFDISESTYRRIIKLNGLSRGSKIENQRIHWVKWQREHPDSLWQLDSWKHPDGNWVIDVIDDCSRFCIGIKKVKNLTTSAVTEFLEDRIRVHGTPRELLTDNGSENGTTSKNSEFDEWCKKHHITHIRSRIHKPTTAGKVERFHQTVQQELPYCNYDLELFRMRYNHIRPHMSLLGKRPAEVYFNLQQRLKTTEQKQQQKWG